jgi:predicted NBD/HSP70 family sugar kinase
VTTLQVVAGVDLGGTNVNYTLVDGHEQFIIQELFEHPARAQEGPEICLKQMEDGLLLAAAKAGIQPSEIVGVGLDTPGPASATGVLSQQGSTNFVHEDWAGFDIRGEFAKKLGKPVCYLNDGNAAALWGHFSIFGSSTRATSISAIIGTGLGGGVITHNEVVKGRAGFGGELGHILLPLDNIAGIEGMVATCNCGRAGDLESLCSLGGITRNLLPHFLKQYPDHDLNRLGDPRKAAKLVRGLAEQGDPMCREIFRVQANALGLFFDIMINTFDPDALIVGGGALETMESFQQWFVAQIRAAMPPQREEQMDIPLYIMPNGDTAGARGAALEALSIARHSGLL